ncbi:RNA-directed DNA polymerase, eukaryota, partial [Tanacetum coccineum]
MNVMSLNIQGLGQSAKKQWIRELNTKNKINFVAIQETKLESINLFSIKDLWGNSFFDFSFSSSVGLSGGILSICLDRHLSDHRLIIMREVVTDYGFHKKGFDKLIKDSWSYSSFNDSNKIILLKKKLQALKASIKEWCKDDIKRSNDTCFSIKARLSDLDKLFDNGLSNEELVTERISLLKELHNFNKSHSLDLAQKAKVRWAIEGDENSKYFHGIINKKRSQLAIRGVLIDGDWIDEPCKVKNEFLMHFANRFESPSGPCIDIDCHLFKKLSSEQVDDLECDVTFDEIKKAVWDCGTNKSPGPDGFSFDFIRTFWDILKHDFV